MDFELTMEQKLLQDSLQCFLDKHYGFAQRMEAVNSAEGWRPQCWEALAEDLGVLGASFAEEHGGLGGGLLENLLVMQAFGGALVVEPYLSTVVIGGGLLRRVGGGEAQRLIPLIIAGDLRIALAQREEQGRDCLHDVACRAQREAEGYRLNGKKCLVLGAPWASHLLVSARTAGTSRDRDGISLFLVENDARALRRLDYPTVDGSRAADIHFDNLWVPQSALLGPEGQGLALLQGVLDEARLAHCAEAVGCMQRMLADTLAYARERRQFGVPIGSFQVLQHRMVEMHIQIEQTLSLTYLAAMRALASPADLALAACAATAQAIKALRFVGQAAVQIHGGMGITEELALGHYFKRATVMEQQFGSLDQHVRRYASLALPRRAQA